MPPKVPPASGVPGGTPPLPPKIPFGQPQQRPPSSLQQPTLDATTATSPPLLLSSPSLSRQPYASAAHRSSSMMSQASDSSRSSLRREVQRRKNSLTSSEFQFLQHVVEVGTEVEVCLVQQKLKDPSLCFDLNEGEIEDDEDGRLQRPPVSSADNGTNDQAGIAKAAAVEDPTSRRHITMDSDASDKPPLLPGMVIDVKQTAFARDISEYTQESLLLYSNSTSGNHDNNSSERETASITGMDGSAGTASYLSSVGGQIPSTPIPTSPRKTNMLRIPDFETLYPEQAASSRSLLSGQQQQQQLIDWAQLQETPVVQNLRRPSALPLDHAAQAPALPVPVRPWSPPPSGGGSVSQYSTNTGPSSGRSLGSERRQSLLEEQRKADPVGPLWVAHENGLAVTPQSSRRSYLRRTEASNSAATSSHHSTPSTAAIRMQYARTRNLSMDSGGETTNSSLLSTRELQKIKLRHSRSQTEWWHYSRAVARQPNQLLMQLPPQINNKQVILRRMLMMDDDYDSILLPTDDEIFRRSQQQQQYQTPHPSKGEAPRVIPEPPAPPMPHHRLVAPYDNAAADPTVLRRMASDGAVVQPQPLIVRRPSPSALRRLKSDCSRKSVSFQLNDHHQQEQQQQQDPSRFPSALLIPNHDRNGGGRPPSWAARIAPNTKRLSQSSFGAEVLQARGSYDFDMDDSLSTFASMDYFSQSQQLPEVPRPTLFTSAHRQDSIGDNSVASLNLHKAHPIRQDSIASTATGTAALEALRQQYSVPEDAVLQTADEDEEMRDFKGPILVPKLTMGRRDSMESVPSLNLHLAHPIRRDSIASTATGLEATETLRQQFFVEHGVLQQIDQEDDDADQDIMVPKQHPVILGRRDSGASIASLNLHLANPIRRDSVASTATGLEATEALRQQFAAEHGDIQDGTDDHNEDGYVPPLPFLRPRIATREESTGGAFVASLNLHQAHPIRSESIASTTASGLEASDAFRRQFAVKGPAVLAEEDDAPSLNLHKAHLIREESIRSATSFPSLSSFPSLHHAHPLRQESMLSTTPGEESTTSFPSIHHGHPIRAASASLSNFPSLHHAHPLRQESIVSTTAGEDAKEAMKRALVSEDAPPLIPDRALLDMESSIMSLGSVASLNIHPAKPLRSESISSTTTGRDVTEYFRKQFFTDKNALVSWEGAVLPEEWEDKKSETDESSFQRHVNEIVRKHHGVGSGNSSIASKEAPTPNRELPRPVIMRYASKSEYDEEGMEVAPAEPDLKMMPVPHDRFWRQERYRMSHVSSSNLPAVVMRRTSQGGGEGVELSPWDGPSDDLEMRREAILAYNHYPSLTSFGSTTTKSVASRSVASNLGWLPPPPPIESSSSFDETKSVDRFRGVFRGPIPQSLSEDELSALLASHCKPKLARGQSDGTVFPSSVDSESWELDTMDGEFDAWNAIKDDYINGYGGGGTLPFQILGTSARDVDAQPHVLSPPLMESLQSFFPVSKSCDNFWMKYSLVRDGASLYTLMQHARGSKYTILALETVDGEVFGAFTGEPWRKTWSYFGSEESFLWRMRKSRKTKCTSIIDQAQMESEIDVYPYTGVNQCIQFCTHDKIAIGGGVPEHHDEEKRDDCDDNNALDRKNLIKDFEWGPGLALQGDLLTGSSSPCVTFGSPSLSKTHSDGSLFEIINLELWTLTPCFNLADAEKLELGRLFLEQSSFHADNYVDI